LQQDREALKEESADLLYHLIVLFEDRGVTMVEVAGVLKKRMQKPTAKLAPLG
jgi:phosphoribosyl-ATP pyrophosphohydrolase/phosphoribosyl-AMP cyclohydrolase